MDTPTRLAHVAELLEVFEELVPVAPSTLVNFLIAYLMRVPAPFFTAPTSSSGRFHPVWANKEQGLLLHTIATMEHASRYCEFLGLDEDAKPHAIAAAMLHDTYKGGESDEWTTTVSDHGTLAAYHIRELAMLYHQGAEEIADAVENHMGRWTPIAVYPQDMDDVTLCVALADYAAAFDGYEYV